MTENEFFSGQNLDTYKKTGEIHLSAQAIGKLAEKRNQDGWRVKAVCFENFVLVEGSFNKNLTFEQCYFSKGIFFSSGAAFENSFSLEDCYVESYITFEEDLEFKDNLNILSSSTKGVRFRGGSFTTCVLNFDALEDIYFDGGYFEDVRFSCNKNSPMINKVKINADAVSGTLNFLGEDTKMYYISVTGGSKDLALTLQDIYAHSLYFFRFSNGKGLKLFNLRPLNLNEPSEFFLLDSNMGKAEFYSINLETYSIVSIVDCYLIESILVGITWPKTFDYLGYGLMAAEGTQHQKQYDRYIEIYTSMMEKRTDLTKRLKITYWPYGVKGLVKLRETYRQLKYSYNKQGDFFEEHRFHILEMNTLQKLLKWRKNGFQKLIILFSYVFSEYGQSLKRPLLGLFIGHWILFIIGIKLGLLPSLSLNTDFSKAGVNNGVFYYFKLINPIRPFDESIHGLLIILDMTMRVWNSYMIYNIIRATRRFIK